MVTVDPTPAAPAGTNKPKKKASAPKKPRSPPSHPTYLEMIGEAIASLKERTGSSQYAITKFVEDKHMAHLPPNFKKLILIQLRKLTASGKLIKIKNSYKLHSVAAAATKPKAAVVAEPKPKKSATAVAGKKRPATVVKPSARAAKSAKTAAKDAPAKKAAKPAVKPNAKVKKAAPSPAKVKKTTRPKSVKKAKK